VKRRRALSWIGLWIGQLDRLADPSTLLLFATPGSPSGVDRSDICIDFICPLAALDAAMGYCCDTNSASNEATSYAFEAPSYAFTARTNNVRLPHSAFRNSPHAAHKKTIDKRSDEATAALP
jgi:hypothetical protein